MNDRARSQLIIGVFALVKLLIPFLLIHSAFELHRDEFLYLADADHLAWGYVEMPPMLAFLGYLSRLMGGSVNTVYLWSALFGSLTVWTIGRIVLQLRGNSTAVFFACLAFLCSAFLRINILFQPNILDAFFWTLSTYFIICWIDTDNKKYLYYLGIAFGLGVLGKYSTLFYIASFVVAVIITRRPSWLANPHFYVAMLLGVVICLPNLLWQWQHNFPVMHHMDLLTKQQLRYNSRKSFLIDQLLLGFPALFIWIGGIWYLAVQEKDRKHISILIIYLGIISILLYFNGKGYYAAAIFPSLMAFGGIWFAKVAGRKNWRWLKFAMPVYMLGLTIITVPLALPVASPDALIRFYRATHLDKTSLLRWEDHRQHPLPQDFSDMLGWKEMAAKTLKVYRSLPDSVKQSTMVYGNNYGEAGALGFYGKPMGMPEVYSDNASYVFWMPSHFDKKYFLFVTEEMPDSSDRFFTHWRSVQVMDSVTTPYARERGAKVVLYSQPDDSVRIIAEQSTARDKALFNMH